VEVGSLWNLQLCRLGSCLRFNGNPGGRRSNQIRSRRHLVSAPFMLNLKITLHQLFCYRRRQLRMESYLLVPASRPFFASRSCALFPRRSQDDDSIHYPSQGQEVGLALCAAVNLHLPISYPLRLHHGLQHSIRHQQQQHQRWVRVLLPVPSLWRTQLLSQRLHHKLQPGHVERLRDLLFGGSSLLHLHLVGRHLVLVQSI